MQDKEKEEFIKCFGEEAWLNEEGIGKLIKYQKDLSVYLRIPMWPIITENIKEDSRLYLKGKYIALRGDIARDFIEALKALIHETRHIYQYYCVMEERREEKLLPAFIDDFRTVLKHQKDGCEEYYENSLELDAFAFTKYYMNEILHIPYNYPDSSYDELLSEFITMFYDKENKKCQQ